MKHRQAFTEFVRESADSVHRAGCSLSAAVVPRTGAPTGPSNYHKWIDENWREAYDYKALADTLDFISSYDPVNGARMRGNDIAYPALTAIISKAGVEPKWDGVQKARAEVPPARILGVAARPRGSGDVGHHWARHKVRMW